MSTVGSVISTVLYVFFFILLARLVFDYVQMFARSWRPAGPMIVLLEFIYTVTDPPLKALRRIIPPVRLGGIAIDLAFMVLSIAVLILARVAADL